MRRAARFTFALIAGLALVTWVASVLVQRTARGWFEGDLLLRAQLAVNGARPAIIDRWHDAPAELRAQLVALTSDERIMAAAACGRDAAMLASTPGFPAGVSCAEHAMCSMRRNRIARDGARGRG